MKNDFLVEVRKEFEKMKHNSIYSQKSKNEKYASLMSLLEKQYNIPGLAQDLNSGDVPKEVLDLYQEISNARDFSVY